MVEDAVWAASGLGPGDGILCLVDLERRLGRPLVYEDFQLTTTSVARELWCGLDRMLPRAWLQHILGQQTRPRVLNMRGRRGVVPAGAVYIGRVVPHLRLQMSRWANPFRIGRDGTRAEVVAKYRDWLLQQPALIAALPELRGKDLCCWCSPAACHGDTLLELANKTGCVNTPAAARIVTTPSQEQQ
jgi:hypothetical protein